MAKKSVTKTDKAKEEKKKSGASAETKVPVKKEAFRLLCGLVSLAAAAFTLFSLISYLFTWSDDQSLFMNKDMFDAAVETENGGGKLGLVWASFLISRLFGLGAFIIPFIFLGVALSCL